MIDLYTWKTSNGRKATIMLEELGVPYTIHPINIGKDEQFAPAYVKINPNSKIPAIIDQNGPGGKPFTLFESGAILMYLAEKYHRFMPTETAARYVTIQWLMFQMGGIGPMFGQTHHFRRAAKEKIAYSIERYTTETRRLWGVLDKRLAEVPFVAGADYTIADIAIFPWTARYEWQGVSLDEFPNAKRWYQAIEARPAVQRGMDLPKD
ncbi:MAG: glutathione S-transferase family protein [Alphaproteobacteria bacterium]|nr:glutathione S-transferase family protein [Alphaproteobacteria bacterium]